MLFRSAALIAASAAAQADNRFPILTPDQMTPEQAKLVQALLAGPRGGGDASPEAVGAMLKRGPFNAWPRTPFQLAACVSRTAELVAEFRRR